MCGSWLPSRTPADTNTHSSVGCLKRTRDICRLRGFLRGATHHMPLPPPPLTQQDQTVTPPPLDFLSILIYTVLSTSLCLFRVLIRPLLVLHPFPTHPFDILLDLPPLPSLPPNPHRPVNKSTLAEAAAPQAFERPCRRA